MPPEILPEIAKLPKYAEEIGRSLVQAADKIFHVGFTKKSILTPTPLETYFLNELRFDWAFFVIKTTDSRILFFFKKRRDTKELISSKVSIVFRLWDVLPDRLATDQSLLTYYYRLPPFIPHFTTQADIDAYAPRMPSMVNVTPENTLTIALGDRNENILSVIKPSSQYDARIRFTPERGVPLEFKGESEWPVVVVIQLTEILRKWAQKKFRHGSIVQFTPSYPKNGQTADDDDKNDVVHAVIEQIARSYFKATNAMMHDNDTIFDSALNLGVGYGIDDFTAAVKMRLNKNGELTDEDIENPFYLSLDLRITQGVGGTKALVSMGPPDFLVTGDTRQCFLDAIKNQDRAIKRIKKNLKKICDKKEYKTIFENNKIRITENEIKAFIQGAEQDSVVFRILHGRKKDTDVIFFKSDFDGIPFYMILCADFKRKQSGTQFNVELKNSSLEVQYFLPVKHRRGKIKNKQVGIHLLRLLLNIHRWIEILD